jgi:asparagine synthase (glutamine-hydrolysing)
MLAVESCWSPWDYTSPVAFQDDNDLASLLHDTIQACVSGWASRYSDVLLGVSGGLDSSIVAACVTQTQARLTCFTAATHEAEGDERSYARLLTDCFNLPLTEHFHMLDDIDVTRSTSSHLPRPLLLAFGQSEHRARRELAAAHGITGHFSGVGGDNVFCFLKSASPLLDRFRTEGLSKSVFATLEDICDLTGCSRTEAIVAALRRAMSHGATYKVGEETRFLNPDYADRTLDVTHPWLEAPRGALPGKGAHIANLARIQGTIDGYARDEAPLVPVLLSQPIMEFCLSIPTWRWLRGGRDRAVARRAFSPYLPQRLIDRRSKGGPNSFAFDVIDSNKKGLREHLFGGLLVEQGLIDPNALAKVLWSPAPVPAADFIQIAMIAEAEAWARYWKAHLRTQVRSYPTRARR